MPQNHSHDHSANFQRCLGQCKRLKSKLSFRAAHAMCVECEKEQGMTRWAGRERKPAYKRRMFDNPQTLR